MEIWGVFELRQEKRPKSEKINSTCKQFSWTLPVSFMHILYFSWIIKGVVDLGKIWNLQKCYALWPGKLFALKICKIGKNAILLNFRLKFLIKYEGYRL